jgi:SAM-dependent methyltransferase/Flp pilus assembly protein TadD
MGAGDPMAPLPRAMALRRSGLANDAVGLLNLAMRDDPASADLYFELGNCLKALGDLALSGASFRRALTIRPDFPQALNNLGGLSRGLDEPEAAARHYGAAAILIPEHPGVQCNLGNALHVAGRLEPATGRYRRALRIDPDHVPAHLGLGAALGGLGHVEDALASYRAALRLAPTDPSILSAFGRYVGSVAFTAWDSEIADYLSALLERSLGNIRVLVRASIGMLRHHPVFGGGFDARAWDQFEGSVEDGITELSRINLLIKVMETGLGADLDLELFLTTVRRRLLLELSRAPGAPTSSAAAFPAALAQLCFKNEYLFFETDEEVGQVERLARWIQQRFEADRVTPEAWILILGAYRPLHGFSWASALEGQGRSPALDILIETQIRSPREDRSLGAGIPRLTPVVDQISRAVRDMYEANPYPRWEASRSVTRSRQAAAIFKDIGFDLDLGGGRFDGPLDILVAGCGTGQQALGVARRFANCSVLAIDLSLASLAYASRRARQQAVHNVRFSHGDILGLRALDRQFDIVECVGVLHHMDSPLTGWKRLADRLRPGGLMKIGLYSELARREIIEARATDAWTRVSPDPAGLRRYRRDLIDRYRDQEPGLSTIVTARDFFTMSEFRDLLFHVREHRFSLPGIQANLEELGLRFLGFELSDDEGAKRFRELHPEPLASSSLAKWHAFEQAYPDTFLGMYQFWVEKSAP